MKVIDWDPEICAGCKMCGAICSFVHEQECTPYLSRINVVRDWEYGDHKAGFCVQCKEAYCVQTCPRQALYRNNKTGAVLVDAAACRGCGVCLASCPVSGIRLHREVTPCELACPLGTDIQGCLDLIAAGKFAEAYQSIRKSGPLPFTRESVCYAPCEKACKRGPLDAPVAIRTLKRFATDNVDYGESYIASVAKNGLRIAVIGSGPAGLTAAHDLALMGYEVTVFESLPEPGGMLRVGIPEYRLPRYLLNKEIEDVKRLGVEIKTGITVGKQVQIDELRKNYQATFIATGAHNNLKLGIPGEQSPGVIYGVDFLRAVNLGREADIGKRVLVIGGGNTAVDAARTARRLGARTVTVLYRRSRTEMPAWEEDVNRAVMEDIEFRFLESPVKVVTSNGKVTGLECVKMQLGEPDASGRRRPSAIKGSEFTLAADTIIAATGRTSELPFGLGDLKTISVGEVSLAYGDDGIFAAGDVLRQSTVVESMAAARRAAKVIDAWLNGIPVTSSFGRAREKPAPLSSGEIEELRRAWGVQKPVKAGQLLPLVSIKSFVEVELGYTPGQAQEEARRCQCRAGTVFKCDLCGGDPECVKWCGSQALTVKEVDSVSLEGGLDVRLGRAAPESLPYRR